MAKIENLSLRKSDENDEKQMKMQFIFYIEEIERCGYPRLESMRDQLSFK